MKQKPTLKSGPIYLQIAVLSFFALFLGFVVFAERKQAATFVDVEIFIVALSLHQIVVSVNSFPEISALYL